MARTSATPEQLRAEDERFKSIREDVHQGDEQAIGAHILEMIQARVGPQDIIDQGLIAAMEEIGRKFKAGDLFIPEVLLSARALNRGLSFLEPYLSAGNRASKGKV